MTADREHRVTLGRVSRDESPQKPLVRPSVRDIQPLDVDGIRTLAVGILVWAVAFVVLLPFSSRLREIGMDWWVWTCVTGIGLGLVGLAYCVWRRGRLSRGIADQRTSGSASS